MTTMGKPEKHVTIKEEPDEAKAGENGGSGGGHPPYWDSEEDHLLSYFLEGTDALARHRSDSNASGGSPSVSSYSAPGMSFAPSSSSSSSLQHAQHHQHPSTMTPVVHYYAGALAKPEHPQSTTTMTTTTSSLQHPHQHHMATMAATLVGGPVPYGQTKNQNDNLSVDDSTISPTMAMLISSNQSPENLLLPSSNNNPSSEEEKQRHLAWLQQINAMAIIARQQPNTSNGGYPPQPPQLHPGAAEAALYLPPRGPTPLPKQQQQQVPILSPAETEEKRVRRLARNRESARQSRARKKEKLQTLEQKVTLLFGQLEQERHEAILEMEVQLQASRTQQLNLLSDYHQLQQWLDELGPNCLVRQRVAAFQYERLQLLLLPRQHQFILWANLQSEAFFNSAKEQKQASLQKSGRISSKQIGEELTLEWKKSPHDDEDEDAALTSTADDVSRTWPLYCFELLISVDQEERLVQTIARSRQTSLLQEDVMQMAVATKMTSSLKKGVLFQAHAASMRSRVTLLDILSPAQSIRYLQWIAHNRQACQDQQRRQRQQGHPQHSNDTTATSLTEICKRLERIMRFPKEPTREGT